MIPPTEITAARNEDALIYHSVRGLYFVAVHCTLYIVHCTLYIYISFI